MSSLPLSLGALTSSFSAPVEVVFFTRPVLGVLVKVSLSPSRLPFSLLMFSQVPLLVLSSLLTILLPSSSSTLHSVAGVATFSDGPALPLLLQFTGNLALVILFTLPWGALSRCSGACVLLIMPHLALRSLPVCSGSPRLCWAPGPTGARLLSTPTPSRSLPTWVSPLALHPRHSTNGFPVKSIPVFTVPFVTDSLPWCLTCMVSLLTSPLTTSSLSFRTPCTRSTCLPLPFVFGVLPAGAMTTLPQAVPLVIGRVPPPAPSVMMLTAPSCTIFPFALLTATPGPLGLILVASPCLMPLCWLSTAGSSTLLMRQTLRKRSVTNSNHHLVEMHKVCAPHSSSHFSPQDFAQFSTQPDSMSISPALAFSIFHHTLHFVAGATLRS